MKTDYEEDIYTTDRYGTGGPLGAEWESAPCGLEPRFASEE